MINIFHRTTSVKVCVHGGYEIKRWNILFQDAKYSRLQRHHFREKNGSRRSPSKHGDVESGEMFAGAPRLFQCKHLKEIEYKRKEKFFNGATNVASQIPGIEMEIDEQTSKDVQRLTSKPSASFLELFFFFLSNRKDRSWMTKRSNAFVRFSGRPCKEILRFVAQWYTIFFKSYHDYSHHGFAFHRLIIIFHT